MTTSKNSEFLVPTFHSHFHASLIMWANEFAFLSPGSNHWYETLIYDHRNEWFIYSNPIPGGKLHSDHPFFSKQPLTAPCVNFGSPFWGLPIFPQDLRWLPPKMIEARFFKTRNFQMRFFSTKKQSPKVPIGNTSPFFSPLRTVLNKFIDSRFGRDSSIPSISRFRRSCLECLHAVWASNIRAWKMLIDVYESNYVDAALFVGEDDPLTFHWIMAV